MSDSELDHELEVCNDSVGGSGSPATSPITLDEPYLCGACGEKFSQPMVLPCLHTFCLACIEKLTWAEEVKQLQDTVTCMMCKQESKVPKNGVAEFSPDHVMGNMLDMTAIQKMEIVCTSCKAKEKAVARCSDCPNFLGPNCVTAHQYMRCFENHKVVSFEDIQNGGEEVAIHKPIFCPTHTTENMKYFCSNCQIPICNECLVGEHKQHSAERILDIFPKQVDELKVMVTEAKSKITHCEEASNTLENTLNDLQLQRDSAKSLIEETFQSYKFILEKCKDGLLRELDELHINQELSVMEMSHNVEKTIEKIEDGCKFTERVLDHGNNIELLSMKKLISTQLLSLINNTPKPEVKVNMDFVSDAEKFEKALNENFGHFVKEDQKSGMTRPSSSLQSSFETEGYQLPANILSPDSATAVAAAAASMLPTSVAEFIPSFSTNSLVSTLAQNISSIASSMTELPSARSLSRNSQSPAMSDSGISDTGGTNSGSNTPLVTLQALGKLGHVGINAQGQITLNGQVIPGLPPNLISPGLGQGDSSLTNMLTRARSQTSGGWEGLSSEAANLLNDHMPHGLGNPPLLPRSQSTNTWDEMSHNAAGMAILGVSRSQSTCGWDRDTLSTGRSQSVTGWDATDTASLLNTQTSHDAGLAILGNSSTSSNTWDNSAFTNNPALNPSLGGTVSAPATPIMGPTGPFDNNSAGYNPNPHPPFPIRGSGKMTAMQIRCKFGQLGPGKSQFNSPHGFCLGVDEDIVVADTNNHRIQAFEKTGEFKYQFGVPGREEGQLWYPRKVAVMRSTGKFVVCDRGNERSRMQIFSKNGHFIKKIAIRYIDIVAGLCITTEGHIVAVDSVSPTIFRISDSGELLCWFDCSDFMREPSDVAMCDKDYYVCDFKGHCVVVVNADGEFLRRVGCENITNFPNGIDVSDAGDVLVGDSHGNRFHVAVFKRDGSLGGEYECPYVKVSRCCGLKLSSEGYVVTLAKNNHHVLVLNTLYIT